MEDPVESTAPAPEPTSNPSQTFPGPAPQTNPNPAAPPAWYSAAPKPRRRVWPWFALGGALLLGFLIVVSGFFYMVAHSFTGSTDGFTSLGDNIGVIDIDGEIASADTIVDQLRKFNQNDSIKAIILHIDSPGGGAAASQEIYHEVLHIREQKRKPIVASIESVGASGAYYIASATDKIYANDASVVGSIGVIMEWTNYGNLMQWARLSPEVIHAGALKDAGDPTRPLTPQERAYFQSLVDNMYGQFVHDVATGRHLPEDQVRSIATGQVWTGQQALPMHLIDKEGGFRVALLDTAKSVGISGEPDVVKPYVRHRTFLDLLGSDADSLLPNPTKLLDRHAGFYFLWR